MSGRILITSFTFAPQKNGVSNVVYAHAKGLAAKGYDVTVATGYDEDRSFEQIHGIKIWQFKVSGSGSLRSKYSGQIEEYMRFVRKFDGDAILCHGWQIWSTDFACKTFADLDCKKILVSHGISATRLVWSLKGLINRLCWQPYISNMPKLLSAFDHVVLLSNRVDKQAFYDRYLMDRMNYSNYSVIPNGVEINRFENVQEMAKCFRRKWGLGDRKILLCVSYYSDMKNQLMALRAFERIDQDESSLVFIGNQLNDYAEHIKKYIEKSNRLKNVQVLAGLPVEEINKAYCAADIVICPSKVEVLPLVLLEAMASGTPFISTNIGAASELPGGAIVENEFEMSKAMSELLLSKSIRQELSKKGLEAFRSTYNWPSVIEQYDQLIKRLICNDRNECM